MASGILRTLGVHMGADCGPVHGESAFFREINVRMLLSAGASWYRPGRMRAALSREGMDKALVAAVRRAAAAPTRATYLGVEPPEAVPRFSDLEMPWGWKDPRTTLTLPLWRRVFDAPKVIHIVRNGVDVAESLIERERRAPRLPFAMLRYRLKRLRPWPWSEIKLRPFRDHQEAFDLWADYVQAGVDATAAMDPRDVFTTRFEDLVSAPRRVIREWADFVRTEADGTMLDGLATEVDAGRRFAFVARSDLVRFHDRCADHPLMTRFEYDRLPS